MQKYKKQPVSQITNEKNLFFISNLLKDFEYFIFFGTLLGFYRDNKLIDGDDDIDIYVNFKNRDKLISLLKKSKILINLNYYPNNTPYFLQIRRKVDNEIGLIDFYFYEINYSTKNIVDRWNFAGKPFKEKYFMYVPYEYIYPIKIVKFNNKKIKVPYQQIKIIKYLYGKTWNIKLKKLKNYRTHLLNNKPIIFYGFTGEIKYYIYKILSILRLIKFG